MAITHPIRLNGKSNVASWLVPLIILAAVAALAIAYISNPTMFDNVGFRNTANPLNNAANNSGNVPIFSQ